METTIEKASPEMILSASARIATKIGSCGALKKDVQAFMQNPDDPLWKAIEERFASAALLDIDSIAKEWYEFYKTHFGIELAPREIHQKLPRQISGFNRLIVVPYVLTVNEVWTVCKKHFKCWKYIEKTDLEDVLQDSERGSAKATTVRWFRDCTEADEETANQSAQELDDRAMKGITLLERMVFELKYFLETGKHLDRKSWTLCSGSRYINGDVPVANWDSKGVGFCIHVERVGRSDQSLRARIAVGR